MAVPLCAEALPPGSESRLESGTDWWLVVMGRLKPGVSKERASAQLAAISPALFEASLPSNYPRESVASYLGFKLHAVPAAGGISHLRERYTRLAAVPAGDGGAGAARRLREPREPDDGARDGARARARGASRARGRAGPAGTAAALARACASPCAAAVTGAWVANALSGVLVSAIDTRPSTLFLDIALDWRVFGFAAAAAVLTLLLFGLAPALRSAHVAPAVVMRVAARGSTEGRARLGVRRLLVVGQVALSLVLVAGAFLLARSLATCSRRRPGSKSATS